LTEREHEVVEAMRNGDKYRRMIQTVLDIEDMLKMYDVPIMAPLADSVLMVCERNEKLEDLLQQCYRVVGNDELAAKIKEVLDDVAGRAAST
jgi:hypothetical protein